MKTTRNFLLLLLIGIASLNQKALCSEDNGNEYTAPDYPDDDADVDDYDGPPPKILSTGGRVEASKGETISLPCEVQNRDNAVTQWRRRASDQVDTPLYFDRTKQNNDPRFHLDASNTLSVKEVRKEDAGEYTCNILGEEKQSIVYTVDIKSEPKITRLVPEGKEKVLRKGNPLTLMCAAIGEPKPKIYWTHKKKHSVKEEPLEGETITYDQVSRKTSGEYTCTAENNKGKDQKTIIIDVHYEPEVEMSKDVVNSAEGYESELVCVVHAHPPAKVTWYKDDRVVRQSHHINQVTEGNSHILRISNTKNSDFGTYRCVAHNEIGSSNKTCQLSGLPSKPMFLSTTVADDGKSPVLSWKVSSYSPITSFELLYKKQEEDKWNSVQPSVVPEGENAYLARQTLKNLEPGTYVAQIKAKNSYGWSSLSESKTFFGDVIGESAMQSKYLESSQNGCENLEMRISLVLMLSLIAARLLS